MAKAATGDSTHPNKHLLSKNAWKKNTKMIESANNHVVISKNIDIHKEQLRG